MIEVGQIYKNHGLKYEIVSIENKHGQNLATLKDMELGSAIALYEFEFSDKRFKQVVQTVALPKQKVLVEMDNGADVWVYQ